MPLIPIDTLIPLQQYQEKIRNICVLAHVDHGKTTLSDQIISSNGIISQPMAGKLRYLDFLQEEQEREITMKSAAIALLFQRQSQDSTKESFLINLIDSPGHVDFSSEVSTAVRITDGALVLVDAVEGVCIQTHAVLKQAYQEKVKPCLVLNKIDRLIGELHMTPLEAYQHLKKIIEQVNVITGTLTSEEIIIKETSETLNLNSDELDQLSQTGTEYYFSPQKGNVAFTTAYDGWGFTIKQFVDICNKKTGIKKSILEKTLWGEYYYHPKEKKIYTSPRSNLTPMFVSFILNSVWEVYKSISAEWIDRDKLGKVINALQLQVNEREYNSSDYKVVLKSVLNSWLPLSDAVLGMVVEHLPNPIEGQSRRMEKIFKLSNQKSTTAIKQHHHTTNDDLNIEDLEKGQLELFKNTMECNKSDDCEIVAFVAKVISYAHKNIASSIIHRPIPPRRVQPSAVPKNRQNLTNSNENNNNIITPTNEIATTPITITPITTIPTPLIPKPIVQNNISNSINSTEDEFIAVVRVFSGTLKKGSKVYILGPRFDPLNPTHDIIEFEISQLYILMGNSLEPVNQVPAGNICGIGGGIGSFILKSATISSSKFCPPLVNMSFVSSPIVKVAIEPENLTDMPKLLHGLKLLNQSDPLVEVYVQETGEHVIVASGELHLERCISDLKDSFAKISVNVSSPIVPFRETIINPPTTTNSPINSENTINNINNINNNNNNNKSPILNNQQENQDIIKFKTANKKVTISMRAIPLPKNITDLIEKNSNTLRDLFLGGKKENKEISNNKTSKKEAELQEREEFKEILEEELKKSGDEWKNEINNIWSFGSKHIGPNILLNHIPGYSDSPFWKAALSRGFQKKTKSQFSKVNDDDDNDDNNDNEDNIEKESKEVKDIEGEEIEENGSEINSGIEILLKDDEKFKKICELDNSIVSGFQMATGGGPICDEPMMGVCLVVENIEFAESVSMSDGYGPLSGQMISATKEACRIAFQTKPQRLMEAMYFCEVQVSSIALGKMYSVLSSRRARILTEGIKEGTPIFCIQARLPVAESFGFNQQIMIKTSGAASTQLQFDNYWECIPQDPYYTPTTDEELEENGVNIASLGNNIATQYMNLIRKRKGLMVEEKLVEHADKQRTLSKNK